MPDKKFVPHEFQNNPNPLNYDPAYNVDARKFNDNFKTLSTAIGVVRVLGEECTEGSTHYGSSSSTRLCFTLPPEKRALPGDVILAGDGTRSWRFICEYEDEVKLTDDELTYGNEGMSYEGILSNLRILIIAKESRVMRLIGGEDLIQQGDHGVYASSIKRTATNDQTIEQAFQVLSQWVNFGDGELIDNSIDSIGIFKREAFEEQSLMNLLMNPSFRGIVDGKVPGWQPSGGTIVDDGEGVNGGRVLKWTASAGHTLQQRFKILSASSETQKWTLSFWAKKSGAGNTLRAVVTRGADIWEFQFEVIDSWTRYYFQFEADFKESDEVMLTINADEGGTYHFSNMYFGAGKLCLRPDQESEKYSVIYMTFSGNELFSPDWKDIFKFDSFPFYGLIKRVYFSIADPLPDTMSVNVVGATSHSYSISSGQQTDVEEVNVILAKDASARFSVRIGSDASKTYWQFTLQIIRFGGEDL